MFTNRPEINECIDLCEKKKKMLRVLHQYTAHLQISHSIFAVIICGSLCLSGEMMKTQRSLIGCTKYEENAFKTIFKIMMEWNLFFPAAAVLHSGFVC